jgi:hypothetical protein
VIIDAYVIAAFRISPYGHAFADTTKYPDALVQYALCEADTETGSPRWGAYQEDCHNLKQRGMFLYAAAWLGSNYANGIDGAPDLEARLNVASKSVGDESISYRVPAMLEVNNDWLTYTAAGQQFYRLRKRVGMGAVAV